MNRLLQMFLNACHTLEQSAACSNGNARDVDCSVIVDFAIFVASVQNYLPMLPAIMQVI